MNGFVSFDPKQWQTNPFSALDDQWMLICAGQGEVVNAMTASWGGFGVLWNKNVATIYVRTTRYTRELLDQADTFSLAFFDPSFRDTLTMLGTQSGRDTDKMQRSGLTVQMALDTPVFAQAQTVLVCKKLYEQLMERDCAADKALYDRYYDEKNAPHILYIGEIVGAYRRA